MTIWERFTRSVTQALGEREGARPTREPRIEGLSDKLGLPRLSDDALGAELERRRRARGKAGHRRPAGDEEIDSIHQARRTRMRDKPLSKAFASLELSPSASRRDAEQAFRKLLRQYHPDRHIGDPEQHKSALALATSLTDAYLTVLQSTRF
jgi:DnaJ-domain-containing protein 1